MENKMPFSCEQCPAVFSSLRALYGHTATCIKRRRAPFGLRRERPRINYFSSGDNGPDVMVQFKEYDDVLFESQLYGKVAVSWDDFSVENADWCITLGCTYPPDRQAGKPCQIRLNRLEFFVIVYFTLRYTLQTANLIEFQDNSYYRAIGTAFAVHSVMR